MSSAIAAQAFGTLGAVFWSIQLLPQIYTNHKRSHTHGLQPMMMLLWSAAGIPLGVYNIVRSFPVALQVQPQILTFLSLITWAQTQYYPPARDIRRRSKAWCCLICATACMVCAAIECGLIFGLRAAVRGRSEEQIEYHPAIMTMGVLAAILLSAGVAAHYVDIWQEATVRGISFLFVGLDALGDLTSLISVALWWNAGEHLDILGLVVYGCEFVLWSGIMLCGIRYNLWPKLRRYLVSKHNIDVQETTLDVLDNNLSIDSEVSGSAFRTASRPASLMVRSSSSLEEDNEVRRRHLVENSSWTLNAT